MGIILHGYTDKQVVVTHPDCAHLGLVGTIRYSWMDPGKMTMHVVDLGVDAPTLVLERGQWRYAAEHEKSAPLELPGTPNPLSNGGLRRILQHDRRAA